MVLEECYAQTLRGLVGRLAGTERRAIATLFYDMDKAITALADRLDKNRAIKLGMMQQLLASSIRVPILDVPVKGWPVR